MQDYDHYTNFFKYAIFKDYFKVVSIVGFKIWWERFGVFREIVKRHFYVIQIQYD